MLLSDISSARKDRLLFQASFLAWITIAYNILEGLISVVFGLEDDALSLFGFGLDSFVEVVSGIGILHMVRRMRHNPERAPDLFEQRALKITGSGFYVLCAGLVVTAGLNLFQGHRPDTTLWGIIVGGVSIITMSLLIHFKKNVGKELNSEAILADANCTKACLYLSFVLLIASAGYEFTGLGGLDAFGALGIAWFAYREGREAFEKSQGKQCSCSSCG
jgi:divalent metal cation (Fe/Co/Zn/Cd) transporter